MRERQDVLHTLHPSESTDGRVLQRCLRSVPHTEGFSNEGRYLQVCQASFTHPAARSGWEPVCAYVCMRVCVRVTPQGTPAELRAVAGLWLHCRWSLSSTRLSFGSEKLCPLFGMANKAMVPHRESHQLRAVAHAMGGQPPPPLPHGWELAILSSTLGVLLGSSLKAKPFPRWAFCSASHKSPSLLCWNTNK